MVDVPLHCRFIGVTPRRRCWRRERRVLQSGLAAGVALLTSCARPPAPCPPPARPPVVATSVTPPPPPRPTPTEAEVLAEARYEVTRLMLPESTGRSWRTTQSLCPRDCPRSPRRRCRHDDGCAARPRGRPALRFRSGLRRELRLDPVDRLASLAGHRRHARELRRDRAIYLRRSRRRPGVGPSLLRSRCARSSRICWLRTTRRWAVVSR